MRNIMVGRETTVWRVKDSWSRRHLRLETDKTGHGGETRLNVVEERRFNPFIRVHLSVRLHRKQSTLRRGVLLVSGCDENKLLTSMKYVNKFPISTNTVLHIETRS